jgi:hypothetical protein
MEVLIYYGKRWFSVSKTVVFETAEILNSRLNPNTDSFELILDNFLET